MGQLNLGILMKNANEAVPSAGDVIFIISGDDIGKSAVISGTGAVVDGKSRYATVNASAYRENDSVSCSGGMSVTITRNSLSDSGHTTSQRFWSFPNGAGPNKGVDFNLDVKIWLHDPLSIDSHVSRVNYYNPLNLRTFDEFVEFNQMVDNVSKALLEADENLVSDEQRKTCYRIMRGKVVLKDKAFHNFNCYDHDIYAQAIVAHFKKFSYLMITESNSCHPEHKYYVSNSSIFTNLTAFKNDEMFYAWIDAYKLKIVEGRSKCGRIRLEPNLNIEQWEPLVVIPIN